MSADTTFSNRPNAERSAAAAAGARAESCRRRIAALQAGRSSDASHVQAAHEALVAARQRARAAQQRLAGRRHQLADLRSRTLCLAVRTATAHAVRPASGLALRARLDASPYSLDALHAAYFALGGDRSLFEVDAYVNGVAGLPALDRDILAHALWELQEFS